MSDDLVSVEELRKLQKNCGTPKLPTQLTYQLRMAVSGHKADEMFSHGYQWADKPHRLVYTACAEIEEQADRIEAQAAEIERLREALTNICWTTIAPKAHKIAQAALAGKAPK
jgi:hypothetical protein